MVQDVLCPELLLFLIFNQAFVEDYNKEVVSFTTEHIIFPDTSC